VWVGESMWACGRRCVKVDVGLGLGMGTGVSVGVGVGVGVCIYTWCVFYVWFVRIAIGRVLTNADKV